MIQRIQSIYLFLIFILFALLFVFPLAGFISADMNNYLFRFNGIIENIANDPARYANTFEVGVLIAVISLISLTTIFLYNKRNLQIRLCIYNTILMVALACIIAVYSLLASRDLNAEFVFKFASSFIIISIILSVLAFRKIRQDEQLIRGLDRIR